MKHSLLMLALGAAVFSSATLPAHAMGAVGGPVVRYASIQGQLGEVIVNPYKVAPLTAVIKNGGYDLESATVTIVPKENGQTITYNVPKKQLLTHGGIPVFGLYADYRNEVKVSYVRNFNGKKETISESYFIYCSPVSWINQGTNYESPKDFTAVVKKVDPAFSDRLYLISNIGDETGLNNRAVWNNPMGGALTWNFVPQIAVFDTKGEIRWYLDPRTIWDPESIYSAGVMMGFRQNDDGALTWGFGQKYVKYDIIGREIWNRRLPASYNDYSHSMDPAQNGHYFLRVASADHRRPDNKRIRTVRDVIAEVDEDGVVVDEFKLWDILDPYRSDVIRALDQGAVCLNIDASKAGHTLSAEELAQQDKTDNFGDIAGSGAGRNWAHVNSVDYDPSDDSIIISSRHQSAIIKIGRDKKVKWILSAPKGWRSPWKDALLTPVDKKGKTIKCTDVSCEGGFDWTWTQHTAFRIDSKSDKDVIYVSAFDNGDARGMEQPALPSMKYSRAVVYRIDQKKMTVEQVWEYGKERGHEWFSPVTSLTEYNPDKNSILAYSATAGAAFDLQSGAFTSSPNPWLEEFKWGETEPAVEIQFQNTSGYQAMVLDVNKAFGNPQ